VARSRQAPGIGLVTAAAAVSRLQDKQLAPPDAFVAYLGLDIKVRESGQRKGELGLTKEGDAELRRLFFCCAQASLRSSDSPFKAHYERERKKGLTATGAWNAVARKMARMCWSIVRHGTDYDPDRVYPRKDAEQEPAADA
jgi:transposase